jgi:NADPH:quinone reductase-like Zn-dependent oxidoreductase
MAVDAGARVVALVRPDNADYAVSLGAADTVDYTAGDLADRLQTDYPDGADAVADFAGNVELIEALAGVLKSGGRIASSIARLDEDAYAARGLTFVRVSKPEFSRMADLLPLIVAGRVKPPGTTVISLDQVADALVAARAKHTRGKVVVRIGGAS